MLPRLCGPRRENGFLPVLVVLVILFTAGGADARSGARLMVYLEVPGSVVSTELSLDGLQLEGGTGSVALVLKQDRLISADLAGKQILLSSTPVPPGLYRSLRIDIGKIVGQVGVARVVPSAPPAGLTVPLDLELRAGATTTVFLQWRPAAVDPEAEFHFPAVEVLSPVIPPLGSLAFVSSGGSGSVVIINRLNSRVVGALAVGGKPRGLAYSPGRQTLFVALAGPDAIAEVDVMSLRLNKTVPLQFGDDPTRLLISRDESALYVISPGSRTLTGLSVGSLQQLFRLAVGEGPRSLAEDPVSGDVYVACEDEGRVQIVAPRTGTITGSLALVSAPVEVVIDDSSRFLFLGGATQRWIRSFDLAGQEVGADQNICGPVGGFAVNRRTRRLYASIPACRNIAVIRPDVGIEFGSISLPGKPGLPAFDQESRWLWVVMPEMGAVAVCSVNRGQLESVIQVDSDPYQVLAP